MAPDRLEAALTILERLISFDTESSKSNLALVAEVEFLLRERGVNYVKVPNAAGDKAALFATIGPMIDGGVVLSGHTDVVPVAGQPWSSDPFRARRADGRVYGRGACDMKGFDAVALAMIEEFQRAPLRRPIHILFSYDEETTCLGPVDTIARFGKDLPRPGAVIVGEPTMMRVADAHKSVTTHATRVRGVEAHSSMPASGANAIETACELVGEIYRFAETLAAEGGAFGRFDPAGATVAVGVINGGTARNILARDCSFLWEYRGLPGAPADRARRHLDDFVATHVAPKFAARPHRVEVETTTEVEIPGLSPEPGSAAETLAFKLARANHAIAVSYATEAGRFQAAGVPTVVCGPGSIGQAHQPDEYIEVSQIEAGIDFMRALTRELI